jgi:uncharacterized membrane protein (DUF441 family)
MKNSIYSIRKSIPITGITVGLVFVFIGVLVLVVSENIGVSEMIISVASVLLSGPWFFLSWLGLRTINIEEKIFQKYGEEGVKKLRKNNQEFITPLLK